MSWEDFNKGLQNHGLVDQVPHLARRLALRETAKVAMLRLHFSRSIRRGELAKSRSSTQTQQVEPGQIVYFWRESKYNPRSSHSRRKLLLRRWHGPALLVAIEGHANAFVSFRGQMTKCALEHIRPASSLEQISAETWRDAIEESVEAALQDLTERGADIQQGDLPDLPLEKVGEHSGLIGLPAMPVPEASGTLSPQEIAAALQSTPAGSQVPPLPEQSRRSSLLSSVPEGPVSTAAPGTPIPDLIRRSSQSSRGPSGRLRELVTEARTHGFGLGFRCFQASCRSSSRGPV